MIEQKPNPSNPASRGPASEHGAGHAARLAIEHLRASAEAVVRAALGPVDRRPGPNEAARRLDIDPKLAWKVLHIVDPDADALAVTRYVPGRVALQRFADACRRHGADPKSTADMIAAAERFRGVAKDLAGSERSLRLVADHTAALPDPGSEAELRRGAFDAYAFATGMRTRALWWCSIVYPASNAGELALAVMHGRFGVERLRKDAIWHIAPTFRYDHDGAVDPDSPVQPLAPFATPTNTPHVIERFCTKPAPKWKRMPDRGWALAPGEVGTRGRFSVVLGERMDGGEPHDAATPLVNSYQVAAAAEILVGVQLVHKSLRVTSPKPALSIILNDAASLSNAPRTVPTATTCEPSRVLTPPAPRLARPCAPVDAAPDMVRTLLERSGNAAEDVDAYEFKVPWPLFGSVVRLKWNRRAGTNPPRSPRR